MTGVQTCALPIYFGRLVWERNVLAVEEGAGPLLNQIYLRYFGVPVPVPTHVDAHRPTDGEAFPPMVCRLG